MRRFVIAGLAVAFLGAASTAFAADDAKASVKIGGGMLYNNKQALRLAVGGKAQGGGHISVDINVPEKQVAFSPAVDIYRKSGVTSVWGGLNILIKPKTSGDKGSVYFGVGGGVLSTKAATAVGTRVTKSTQSKGSFDVLVGANIKASDKVGIFIEPRYVWAASSALNGVAAHVGLAFHVK
jgi:hypothetical protein